MEINETRRQELIKKYRIPVFEARRRHIYEIDNLISDKDLVDMIEINNNDIEKMIYSGNINQEELNKLVYANINFYNIASHRKISVSGKNTLVFASSFIVEKSNNNSRLGAYVVNPEVGMSRSSKKK